MSERNYGIPRGLHLHPVGRYGWTRHKASDLGWKYTRYALCGIVAGFVAVSIWATVFNQ